MTEFPATLMTALGHALLHFLWQGVLIGSLAALALQALRAARPQVRYAAACFALLACVLAPLGTFIVQLAAASPEPLFGAAHAAPLVIAAPQAHGALFGFVPASEKYNAYLPWIVALWAAGASVMSLRIAMGLVWIQRLRNTPQGELQATWQSRLDAIAVHFGLSRGVALRLVDNLDTPVSAGWWRPVVLLPVGLLTRMPTDLIEALLAHELAHIRRHDYLVNLLQNAVEALLFYHPVTWWLSRRIRAEREQIADQLAAEVVCAPRRLAVALYELSEIPRTHPTLHLAQAARGGQLMSRIEQLIRPTRRAHPSARIVFPLLGLAAACIATFTYAQTTRPQQQTVAAAASVKQPVVKEAVKQHVHLSKPQHESFAYVPTDGDSIMLWGSTDDLPAIKAAKHYAPGDYLWANRGGKNYVVTDPAMLTRARESWREAEAIGQQMEALSGQMQVHSKKMEALGTRMQELSPEHELSAESQAAQRAAVDLARQQAALARQQLDLAGQQLDAQNDTEQQQRLSREQDALSAKQDALASQQDRHAAILEAEAKRLEASTAPMEALSKEMESASKPLEALGKQMEALGAKHEKVTEQAERELSALVSEALAKGLAKPAPVVAPTR
ncbi:M56 family metallopeptidase [Lysobacter tyrosinilyticus]